MSEKRKKPDPMNVTINFTLRLDDEDPRMVKIAKILREGRPIDKLGLYVVRGKDLCMYALELLDHVCEERAKESKNMIKT